MPSIRLPPSGVGEGNMLRVFCGLAHSFFSGVLLRAPSFLML